MIHFFTVKPASTQGQEQPPQADGAVIMKESGYVLPGVIAQARALTLYVTNQGSEAHEFNIVKLAVGKGIQDIVSFFQAPSGPPPFEEEGGMAALVAGGSGWIKTHLEPGTYAAFSFIPDQRTGKPQLIQGMITQFTVQVIENYDGFDVQARRAVERESALALFPRLGTLPATR